jgi:hypothetical protein
VQDMTLNDENFVASVCELFEIPVPVDVSASSEAAVRILRLVEVAIRRRQLCHRQSKKRAFTRLTALAICSGRTTARRMMDLRSARAFDAPHGRATGCRCQIVPGGARNLRLEALLGSGAGPTTRG